jgi:hypothetical protein
MGECLDQRFTFADPGKVRFRKVFGTELAVMDQADSLLRR